MNEQKQHRLGYGMIIIIPHTLLNSLFWQTKQYKRRVKIVNVKTLPLPGSASKVPFSPISSAVLLGTCTNVFFSLSLPCVNKNI